jgi:ATP-binding protein involved in chromosome partitioning
MVSDVIVQAGKIMFSITVPAERAKAYEPMRAAAETAVRALPGVSGVMVALTAEKKAVSGSAPHATSGPAAGRGPQQPQPQPAARGPSPQPAARAAAGQGGRSRRRCHHCGRLPARAASANRPPLSISRWR